MKDNKYAKMIIIAIILMIIILIMIIVSLILDSGKAKEQNIIQTSNSVTPENLSDLNATNTQFEYDRIKSYLDKYLYCLEEKNYEKAYIFLHDDFKKEHFQTLEKYREYVSKKYYINNIILHDGYDKLGQYHILTVKFSDILNATDTSIPTFVQKFIIVENGLNDFKLSFQAE